jgi:hypothetical protein
MMAESEMKMDRERCLGWEMRLHRQEQKHEHSVDGKVADARCDGETAKRQRHACTLEQAMEGHEASHGNCSNPEPYTAIMQRHSRKHDANDDGLQHQRDDDLHSNHPGSRPARLRPRVAIACRYVIG